MEKIYEKLVIHLRRKRIRENMGLWVELTNGRVIKYRRKEFSMKTMEKAINDLFNSK